MPKLKFVADGFHQDAESLLEEFSKKDSKHFSAFAESWKGRDFSSMFMDFDDEDELREFTEEIFHVASKFVAPTSPIRQVGGIYLLYALYRHQTLNPPVRIRLVLGQMDAITKLGDSLSFEDYKTFHYVVSYLLKNSFDFVACPRPMGPTMSVKLTEDWKRECKDNLYSLQVDLKKDMAEFAGSRVLKEIGDLFAEYSDAKNAIKAPGLVGDVAVPLLDFTSRLECMLNTSVRSARKSTSSHVSSNSTCIGLRRVGLKMKAFGVPARYRKGIQSSLAMEDESDDDLRLRIVTPTRRPPRKRGPKRVGRPKKEAAVESDDDLDTVVQKPSVAKVNHRRCRITRYHYSQGEERQKISYYESLKFDSNNAGCQLFSDSEVDDPEPSAAEYAEENTCTNVMADVN